MADKEETALSDDAPGLNTSDEAILKEARERMQMCIDAEKDNRAEALDDLRMLTADHWPAAMRRQRESDGRPCLTFNKLPAIVHQVTNDQRQNCPSIKVHPVDNDADEETAEVIQGLIRHAEYNSNASVAYDTAVNSAASIGFGYFRMVTEYTKCDSFEQDIKFKRIANPFTVYIDPSASEPDGSDMNFAFISEEVLTSEVKREYPDIEIASDTSILCGTNDVTPTWLNGDRIRLAEYMRVEETPMKLYRLPDGSSMWADDEQLKGVDKAALNSLQSREGSKREVWWYKLTGSQVLNRKKIDCYWIPLFPVYGDEVNIDGKIVRAGLIRNAKDPQKNYNFWMTSATEEVALRTKTPYIGAEGQFEGYETEWANANQKTYSYLEYKPTTVDGVMAPPPQRQPMADIPSGALAMAMHASDDIKATTGIFDASMGARSNETSGKAIMARQREGDVGSFHYADNLNITLRHAGRCFLSFMPYVYDTERVIRIMGANDEASHVTINQPNPQPQQPGQPVQQPGESPPEKSQGVAYKAILNNLTVGEYDVTCASGPSYTTLRQESVEASMQLAQAYPPLMQAAGDLIVKMMDWPGAEEISERLKKMVPPQLLEGDDGDTPPIPPQVQAQMQQMKDALAQVTHALEQAHQEHTQLEQEQKAGLEKQTIASSAIVQQRQIHSESTLQAEQMRASTQIEVAKINADGRRDAEEIKGMVAQLLALMVPAPQFVDVANEPDEA